MVRVLHTLLLIALALAPAGAARGGPGTPSTKSLRLGTSPLASLTSEDRELLASLGHPRPCADAEADDAADWLERADGRLEELVHSCRDRVPPDRGPRCDLDIVDLLAAAREVGFECLPAPTVLDAAAHYHFGSQLLEDGDPRAAEYYLYLAQGALPDSAPVLRRWNRALGEQLQGLALDQPMSDRYARDILVLTHAALRFIPDDPKLLQRKEWAQWAVGEERLAEVYEDCRSAASDQRWDDAVTACDTLIQLQPGHLDARDLLTLTERKQEQRAARRSLGRLLLLIGGLLLAAFGFLVVQGDLFYWLGKLRLALAAYSYLAALAPGWRKPYLRIARIHQKEGNARDEEAILQRAHASWPEDTTVLQRMFEFYSRVGDTQGVRDTILELSRAGELGPDQLAELLEAQRSLGLLEDDLLTRIEAQVERSGTSPLLPLLALGYAQRGRVDDKAAVIYERSLTMPEPRLRFLVPLARVELAEGRTGDAIEHAEQAVAQNPTAEAVDCLSDALVTTEREEHIIWTQPSGGSLVVLYPALLKVAGRRPDLAPMIVDRLRALYEETTDPSLGVLTAGIVELLEERDCREQLLTAADAIEDSVPYLKAVQAACEEYARRHPDDGYLWLRLADVHHKLLRYGHAALALERAFHIPETRPFAVRQATAMVHRLETYRVIEVLAALLGLDARPVQQSREGFVELLLTNTGRPLSGWWRELDQARVRVYTGRPPSQEDVIAARRALAGPGGQRGGLAILVSAGRPSAGTIELIMSSMIEQPRLRMFPLEERTLRDAVAELRPRAMLAQLRSQWLLGEDLFDKKDPVLDPAEFFGRGQVLRTLVRKAHRGEVFGLFGIRKMGKTSLAHRLRGHLSDAVVAMVDLQEVSSSSCVALARLLCDRALEDWRGKFPQIEPPELAALPEDPDGAMVAFEGNLRTLREAILETQDISTLFFLIDEIENLIPHELGTGSFHEGFAHYDAFFRLLRGLHQTDFRDVFSFAVIGADAQLCLQGRWGGRDNPIFQYLSEFYVGPLSAAETAEMVSTLGSGMGLGFSDPAVAALYDLSGGHPMVCRQLCSETAKLAGEQRPVTIDTADVRAAVDSYLALKKGYFGEILSHYLGAGQRAILDAVAAEGESQITRAMLLDRTASAFDDTDAFDRDLQNLELFSVLQRRGDQYRFAMRLMRTYIRVRRLDIEE
ncbi:MAG: hypothetical protein QGH45_18620 [Myxococcota bacterium]|nr:hypothetical protein [Myxococcota bacterium]